MKKRLFAMLLIACMLLTVAPISVGATDAVSGTCGPNLTWTLNDGVLTISGSGEMTKSPWGRVDDKIKHVVIEKGVTSISKHAFYACENIESVTLPEGLITIGDFAFQCCRFKSIRFPDSLESVGCYAFNILGMGVQVLNVPSNLKYIGEHAFFISPDTSLPVRLAFWQLNMNLWWNPTLCPAPQSEKIINASNEIVQGLDSDYEKAEAIARWVSSNIKYDYDRANGLKRTEEWDNTYTPEAILESRLACCDGYSALTVALLNAQGILAVDAGGFAIGRDGWANHGWNAAYVDGRWIHMDTTFGHRYFDMSLEEFATNHILGLYSIPHAKLTESDQPVSPDNPSVPTIRFADVPSDEYFSKPVSWAVSKGITNGTSETTFSPNDSCTRAHAVTFLWRAAGSPEPQSTKNPFVDIVDTKNTNWYYKAVLWAVEKGITNGTSSTEFSPNTTCNRAQIVTFLHRYEETPAASGSGFNDVPTSEYYYAPVIWAVSKGVTNGTGAGKFSPLDNCTRGQIVTFLYRDLVT